MLKKKEFLGEVAKQAGTTGKEVEEVLTGVVSVVKDELNKGEKVNIPGLCTFTPKFVEGGEKTFRNPMTGEAVTKTVEDKLKAVIKPEKSLLNSLIASKALKKK